MQLFPVFFATFGECFFASFAVRSFGFYCMSGKILTAKDAKKCRKGREDGLPTRRGSSGSLAHLYYCASARPRLV